MKYTMEDLAFIKNGNAPQHKTSEPMTGKICVIAGASSGVGLEAAKKLAAGGARLLLVCRNQGKAERVKTLLKQEYQNDAELVIADFARLDDVRAAAQEIAGRIDHIDVLINSAGLHSTKRRFTGDGNELVFQVNHLASFLFTMLLLNLVKNSEQGRIIQVNSEGHRFGGLKLNDLDWKKRPYLGLLAYGASKTAQLMTVATLAKQLEDTRVTVNAMHPGGVRTSIGSNNGWLYRAWLRGVIWHFLKDPEISGDALYYLAAGPELRNTTGRYFNLTIDEKPMPHALDEAVRDEIWEVSHRLTGL
jgi:NAD(P)-dependent dehydrogenase (short-subunit alcohol dehydrogenase family)